MPNWSRSPIPTLVQDARRLYTNAKGDPEIVALLDVYKLTAAQLDEGLALLAAVEAASGTLGGETIDASQATGTVQQATTGVDGTFTEDRELARTVYRRGTQEYEALGLAGEPPAARAALLGAARDFYTALQNRPALIDPLPLLTPELVAERLEAVRIAEKADTKQADEGGDVEVASEGKKTAVASLRTHASKTARIAKKALKDKPQLREKLGLLERS